MKMEAVAFSKMILSLILLIKGKDQTDFYPIYRLKRTNQRSLSWLKRIEFRYQMQKSLRGNMCLYHTPRFAIWWKPHVLNSQKQSNFRLMTNLISLCCTRNCTCSCDSDNLVFLKLTVVFIEFLNYWTSVGIWNQCNLHISDIARMKIRGNKTTYSRIILKFPSGGECVCLLIYFAHASEIIASGDHLQGF